MTKKPNTPIDRIIIFGRYPIPGKTKTRLIPALGPTGAAELQRELTEKTLFTIKSFASQRNVVIEFCFEGGSEEKVRQWLGPEIALSKQRRGDLGERMYTALLDAHSEGAPRTVLLGTDIPKLQVNQLESAFDALTTEDMVLGPSTDGGYWLIGANRPVDVFQGVDWGTGNVLRQTLFQARKRGISVKRIDQNLDIDTIEDLKRWRPSLADGRPYISVIIPALDEEENIQNTIHKAQDGEVEIIVVDGESKDDTVNRAQRTGVKVVSCPRGRSLQLNMGAEIATGNVLLFLHADTCLPVDYVAQVFDTLMNSKTVLGAFHFKTDLDSKLMRLYELVTNIRSKHFRLPYGDQGQFLRKSTFKAIGGFKNVPIAEDLFLVRQVSKLGRIAIAPSYTITSARRWEKLGYTRTWMINQTVLLGCSLGISPKTLVKIYKTKKAS